MNDYALSEKQALSERTILKKDFLSFNLVLSQEIENLNFMIQREADMLQCSNYTTSVGYVASDILRRGG